MTTRRPHLAPLMPTLLIAAAAVLPVAAGAAERTMLGEYFNDVW